MRRRRWALAFSSPGPACRWSISKCRAPATAAISFARDSSRDAGRQRNPRQSRRGARYPVRAPRLASRTTCSAATACHQHTPATFAIEKGAAPVFQRNVFLGVRPDVFAVLDEARRASQLQQ